MDTAVKWRVARAMLKRAAVLLRKTAQERESLHTSSAFGRSPSHTREKCQSSGDRFTVFQQEVGDLSPEINQSCIDISKGDNDEFKLNSCTKEFVPQLKTTQCLVLNSRAGEFVLKAKQGHSTQPLNFNPRAREFVPKTKHGHSTQILVLNSSAGKFVPKAKQGRSTQPLNFNPGAREFVPKAKQERLTQALVLNSNAEFVIGTKQKHPSQPLIRNYGTG